MNCVDSRKSSGSQYNLYALSLYNLKRRLNSKASKAMENGEVDIILDACLIVVDNGKEKGSMNDSGPTSGKVYTTYNGIIGAANWSNAAKKSLTSYFNKKVDGLFFRINATYDEGISSVSGAGYYCYGTYVTLKAKCKKGYDFEMWSGSTRSSREEVSFYVNDSGRFEATSERKKLVVVFHRNFSAEDSEADYEVYYYDRVGESFPRVNWRKNGQEMLGWALSPNATTAAYKRGDSVKNSWIINYSPQMHLYAVWADEEENDEDTPTPSSDTPTSNTPAPSPTPTPTTPTPAPTTPTPTTAPTSTTTIQTTTDTPEPDTKEIQCRFISSKYFEDSSYRLISSDQGGLAEDSRWAVNPVLRQLLRQVLSSCA